MYVAAARTLFNEVAGALLGTPIVQAPSSPLLTLNMTGRMGKLYQKYLGPFHATKFRELLLRGLKSVALVFMNVLNLDYVLI